MKEFKSDIVLTTDFGLSTGFAASMTGVIRKIDQSLSVFDLNHEIKPFDIKQVSNLLSDTIPYWKEGTVFVSVVDPGVGTSRKSCVALLENGSFIVTPDNGTLTAVFDKIKQVRQIDETVNRLPGSEKSSTFHGRDVYAYTAGRLASGIIDFEGVGPEYPVKDIVRYSIEQCFSEKGITKGIFLGCLKQFGSPTTNIDAKAIDNAGFKHGDIVNVVISHNGKVLFDKNITYHKSFGYVPKGQPVIYYGGTSPYMEIGINMGKFADTYMPDIYIDDAESFNITVKAT